MNTYLKNKGYRTFTNASLLNALGNSLFNIVFIVYASTLPFKTLAVSLASAAMFIPSLFQPFIGHLADKTTEKLKWNILSKLLQFILFLALSGLILLEGSLPLFFILLLINILADSLGFFSGSLQLPFIKYLVPEEDLREAIGFQTAMQTLIQLIFQGLGAYAIVKMNYNFSLFGIINALTFLLAALIIIKQVKLLREFDLALMETAITGNTTFVKDFKETMGILLNNPFLKMIIIFAVLINLLGTSSDGLLNVSLLTRNHFWFGNLANTIALVGISSSIGMLLGSILAKDFFQNVKSLTIITLLLANTTILAFVILFIPSKYLLLLTLFTLGYLLGKINPRLSAYLISEVPQEKLGLTSGIFSILVLAGTPIGQLLFLGTANVHSDSISWTLFGSLSLIFLLISAIFANKVVDPITDKKP